MNAAANAHLEAVARRLERDGREDDAARLRRLQVAGERVIAQALDELLWLDPASTQVRESARAAQRAIRRAA